MTGLALGMGVRELLRSRGRTLVAVGTLTVLSFLTLTLAGLADALDRGSTGVLRALDADLLAFNEEARLQLYRTRVPQALAMGLEVRVEGVQAVGTIGLVPTSAQIGDERIRVTLVGYNARTPAEPTGVVEGRMPLDGEPGIAAADVSLRDRGARLGDEISLAGERTVELVGFVDDSRFLQQPTVWVPPDLWARVRSDALPEAGWAETLAGASVMRVAGGADPRAVAADVEAEVEGLVAVSRDEAVLAIPGVDVQRATFGAIVVLTIGVTGGVTGLLFALLVRERRGQLATLRALGAPAGLVVRLLVAQVVGLWTTALLGAVLGVVGLARVLPDAMPLGLRPAVVAGVGTALLVAALVGTGVAFRRAHRIDPARAMEQEDP